MGRHDDEHEGQHRNEGRGEPEEGRAVPEAGFELLPEQLLAQSDPVLADGVEDGMGRSDIRVEAFLQAVEILQGATNMGLEPRADATGLLFGIAGGGERGIV